MIPKRASRGSDGRMWLAATFDRTGEVPAPFLLGFLCDMQREKTRSTGLKCCADTSRNARLSLLAEVGVGGATLEQDTMATDLFMVEQAGYVLLSGQHVT